MEKGGNNEKRRMTSDFSSSVCLSVSFSRSLLFNDNNFETITVLKMEILMVKVIIMILIGIIMLMKVSNEMSVMMLMQRLLLLI